MSSEEIMNHTPEQLLNQRFQVQHLIKEKGFVRVFLGFDSHTKKNVLIKDLCWKDVADWKSLELFEREVKNLTYLDHPRIPKFIEHFQSEKEGMTHYYLVSEFIDGETLKERLDKGWKVSEKTAKKLAKDLLDILVYLHHFSPPVIHRDIKPQNIILNSDDHAYLIDFDAVKDLAKPGDTVVGTFGYMAPEQFSNQVKPASDLYALGVTLIEMLSRCSPDTIPRKDLHLDYHDLVNISPEFQNWLDHLIEPMLSQRCLSAQEALNTLETPRKIEASKEPEPSDEKALVQTKEETESPKKQPTILPLSKEPITLPATSRIELENTPDIYIPHEGKVMTVLGDWTMTWAIFSIVEGGIYWLCSLFLPFWIFQASFVLMGLLGIIMSIDAVKSSFLSLGITLDKAHLIYEQKWFGRFLAKEKSKNYKEISLIDFTDVNGLIKFTDSKDNVVTSLYTRLSSEEQEWARNYMLPKIKPHVSDEQFQRLLIAPEDFEAELDTDENE